MSLAGQRQQRRRARRGGIPRIVDVPARAMLKQFGQGVWIADGPDAVIAGFHYPTRMAVIRLSGGRLFIWSPIRLTDALQGEVETLGHVRHIVAPNSLHHLSLPEWKRACPDAKIHAPPGLRKKRKDIVFDADLGRAPDPSFSGWRAVVARLDRMVGPEPSVPRKFRVAFTNRRAARESLERILAWPAEKVLMAHGTPVEKDARTFLRGAFEWLAA